VDFKTLDNLASVKGVFQGLYTLHGPFKEKEDAEKFAKEAKVPSAIYVTSNKMLYIPKKEAIDVISTIKSAPEPIRTIGETFPKPKPEPIKPAGRSWLKPT
jgi:hypothetical protein